MTNRRIKLGIDWVLKKGETVDQVVGEKMLRHHIIKRHKQNIPQNKIHAYLLEIGLAKPDPKKQNKRKRCCYEQKHSLSLLHADYMGDEGIHVIAYEDDVSRKILSIGEFNNATIDNALEVLNIAEQEATEVNGLIQIHKLMARLNYGFKSI